MRLPTLVNGEPACRLSVHDRGLAYGDGVFETMRVNNSAVVLADLHWQRLVYGLDQLSIHCPLDALQRQCHQLIDMAAGAGLRDGVVKLIVSRGVGGRGFAPPSDGTAPTVIGSWHPLPDVPARCSRDGVALALCRQRLPHRPWLAGLKHLNCLEYVLARAELRRRPDCYDGLLRDIHGRLVEASSANVFFVRQDCLSTPDLTDCGVAGTMRRWIIESAAPQLGMAVTLADHLAPDLNGVDEIFISNSVVGVLPVRSVDDRQYAPGPVCRALQRQVGQLFGVQPAG